MREEVYHRFFTNFRVSMQQVFNIVTKQFFSYFLKLKINLWYHHNHLLAAGQGVTILCLVENCNISALISRNSVSKMNSSPLDVYFVEMKLRKGKYAVHMLRTTSKQEGFVP